jgi:hypothetical protein
MSNKIDKLQMLTCSGSEIPEQVTKINGSNKIIIHVVISAKNGTYEWLNLKINTENYNYEGVVDAIIGLKYAMPDEIAIMNNYMYDPVNSKYKSEFDDLQKFRFDVKSWVKNHFDMM